MVPPANLDSLSHTELKNLVIALFERVAELRRTVAAQADEIARLKDGPRRPNFKPSGMEKATEPKRDTPSGVSDRLPVTSSAQPNNPAGLHAIRKRRIERHNCRRPGFRVPALGCLSRHARGFRVDCGRR